MSVFKYMLQVWHQPVFKRIILFVARLVPDKLYVKMTFKGKLGYKLNLDNPQTFNEKIQWMKLYYYPKNQRHFSNFYQYINF